jgi:ribosomal protein L34E
MVWRNERWYPDVLSVMGLSLVAEDFWLNVRGLNLQAECPLPKLLSQGYKQSHELDLARVASTRVNRSQEQGQEPWGGLYCPSLVKPAINRKVLSWQTIQQYLQGGLC